MPKSGVVAGVYVQAISAYAPHPNAAKLWLEHLYSDEGQIGWLKGYCHPIRFNNLVAAGKVPADLLAALPPAGGLCEGEVPDARRAEGGQGGHRQASGTPSSARRSRNRDTIGTRASGNDAFGHSAIRVRRRGARDARPPTAEGASFAMTSAPARLSPPSRLGAWLGVAPFFVFAALFLIVPTAWPARRRVPGRARALHLRQYRAARPAVDPALLSAQPRGQRRLGRARRAARAGARARGAAAAACRAWVRPTLMTFSGVASNFAGVPLAFAFMATLGPARASSPARCAVSDSTSMPPASTC